MALNNSHSRKAILLEPHTRTATSLLSALETRPEGLSQSEAQARLLHYGRNALPRTTPPTVVTIFIRQFKSPLIYILLLAAFISLLIQAWSDAGFILMVLLINAVIGAYQEYSAERAAQALQHLISLQAHVLRNGAGSVIDAEELVPGDIILLQSGIKIPADLRLLDSHNLSLDEALLTGESLPVNKLAQAMCSKDTPLAERNNMVFAGTLVTAGRGLGVVVSTGLDTELGMIAASILGKATIKPPLLLRMERFSRLIAIAVGAAVLLIAIIETTRGTELTEIFLLAVALAVAAIPEGLTVAMTIALAVGMQRMARRNVIVRRLIAVESLGSCTCIVTDKTGTLTLNQLTVRKIQLPTGQTITPGTEKQLPATTLALADTSCLNRLLQAAVLANEAALTSDNGEFSGTGDSVDVALLIMCRKFGLMPHAAHQASPQVGIIPYESEQRFAASLNRTAGGLRLFVKGAVETILAMCNTQVTDTGLTELNPDSISEQARHLADNGFRVLAFADMPWPQHSEQTILSPDLLVNLTLLGLVAMDDPLRGEVKAAVAACATAGINVALVTGDHPVTALAVARELGLAKQHEEVVTGAMLAEATIAGKPIFDKLVRDSRVFARAEPQQKLMIVQSLQHAGHFVAVTGDGINDAPALKVAHVGVAMGKGGTDVARETADIVLTDDNFASIVAGVEEGRVAYANVRKVIFMLISTGAGEIVLFFLALLANIPLPLTAIQLLWLNLVTNGVQDIALAFEAAEGDELKRAPRPPDERIFNRMMIERVILSAAVIGCLAYIVFHWLYSHGYSVADSRNITLLMMVLFENVQTINSRSEYRSVFRLHPLSNPFLLYGILAAQLIHVGAMYTPGLREVLGVQPIGAEYWSILFLFALVLVGVVELHKWLTRVLAGHAKS